MKALNVQQGALFVHIVVEPIDSRHAEHSEPARSAVQPAHGLEADAGALGERDTPGRQAHGA